MNFINTIEILSLQNIDYSDLNSSIIKKAKRKILAEIELSDEGFIYYYGHKINESDLDKITNELDNKEITEFHYFILQNTYLNLFLISGDESFFKFFRQESIYKSDNFINFISPYFAIKYNKVLNSAYLSENTDLIQNIVSVKPLVSNLYIDKCYKGISNSIHINIQEINKISIEIKNEDTDYDETDIEEVLETVKNILKPEIINLLPIYFQNLKNKCANTIRNLSVDIFNSLDDSDLALEIINYALDFNIDGLTKQNLEKDYNQINNINNERNELKRIEPTIKKYASLLIEIKEIIEKSNNNSLLEKGNSIYVHDKIKSEFHLLFKEKGEDLYSNENGTMTEISEYFQKRIDVNEINSLGDNFVEIKNQIALGLLSLSISIWNQNKNFNISLFLLKKSISIKGVHHETETKLSESINILYNLKNNKSNRILFDNTNIEKTNKDLTKSINEGENIKKSLELQPSSFRNIFEAIRKYPILFFVLFMFVLVIIFSINSNRNNNSSKIDKSKSTTTNTSTNKNTSSSENKKKENINNKFIGNQLKNGDSPLNSCFGKGKSGGPSYIIFKNNNENDAIVCLVELSSGKTIRNEYIRKGTNYKMKSIPTGTYYLKYVSGNDWNPLIENICGSKGNFQSNVNYTKSDNLSDYIKITNSRGSYSYYNITLYTVAYGNMSQEAMSETNFFK